MKTRIFSLRSGTGGTGTKDNPELGLLERPKKNFFFLGDSKLSCMFFFLVRQGLQNHLVLSWFQRHERQALPSMLV